MSRYPTEPVRVPVATDPVVTATVDFREEAELDDREVTLAPDVAIGLAQHERARGQHDRAVAVIRSALREDGWLSSRLWSELVALMEHPTDYERIRELWLASPEPCHRSVTILRHVARAACMAGQHDDGRLLLRKAIRLQALARRNEERRRSTLAERLRSLRPVRRGETAAEGDRTFEAVAAAALRDLRAAFDALQVRSFLISGTLLGYVRAGDVIPWDKDIDVGIFSEEADIEHLEAVLARTDGFVVRRLDLTTDRLRLRHRRAVGVDVFPHYRDRDGLVWHDGASTRWWNTPFGLREVEFLGAPQYVPDPPERYLDENYGDWRRPDPYFDARLDAPNVEVTDADYFESLLYFSLLSAMRKGNARKEQRYVDLLRQNGESDWVERL